MYKAVWLSEGSRAKVLVAIGAPWHDTKYVQLDGDDVEDMPTIPFLSRAEIDDAFLAARRARFEFGETPTPNLFSGVAS